MYCLHILLLLPQKTGDHTIIHAKLYNAGDKPSLTCSGPHPGNQTSFKTNVNVGRKGNINGVKEIAYHLESFANY